MIPIFSIEFSIVIICFEIYYGNCCQPAAVITEVVNQVDNRWLPTIFHIPRQNTSKDEYEFKCLGVFVHQRAVLAPASCAPVGMRDVTFVRFYDWGSDGKITKQTSYQERSLSNVIDFRSLYPGEAGTNHVNILELSEPMNEAKAVVFKPMATYTYLRNGQYTINKIINCIYVTTEGNMNDGIKIKKTIIRSLSKQQCCYALDVPTDDNQSCNPVDRIHCKCGVRLFGITCFKVSDKNSFVNGGPSFCPDNSYYRGHLQGFVVELNDQIVEFSNFEESISWVKEYLNTLG